MTPLDEKTFRELCLLHALGQLGPKEEAILIESLAGADEDRLVFFAETAGQYLAEDADAGRALPDPELKRRLASLIEPKADPQAAAGSGASASSASFEKPVSAPENPDRSNRMGPGRRPDIDPLRPGLGMPSGRARSHRRLAFASWIIGAGLLAFSALQWQRAERSQAELRRYHARVEALEDSLGVKEALLSVLASPQVHLASLKSGVDRSVSGRVYWDGMGRKGILHVSDLPPAPAGQAYYLWILVDDKVDPCVNAGSFSVRKLRPEGDFYRFEGAEDLSHLKVVGFEITAEAMDAHGHVEGHDHDHEHDHLHPTGKTMLKSETFL